MKRKIFCIVAFATAFIGHSQTNEEIYEFEKQKLEKELITQLELLQVYNEQIEKDIDKIQKQHNFKTVEKKKEEKISHVGLEVVAGVTDNEDIGYHANLSFEINEEKHNGVEMGVFYDANDLLIQDLEVPSEIFIINFGYTKQINFLSNKEIISTRAVLGGAIGAENLNDSKDQLSTGELIETEDGLIYGGYAGIFSRFKINNRFSIIVRNSNFFTTSDVSIHKFIVGGGLRYNF